MVTCLAAHIQPPEEADRWLELLGEDVETGGGLELSWCNLLSARICAEAQQLFDNPSREEDQVLNMLRCIKQLLIVDERLVGWQDRETTGLWSQKQVRTAQTRNTDIPTYVYYNIIVGFGWNYYRAARIHINEVLRHCIEVIKSYPSFEEVDLDLDQIEVDSAEAIEELVVGVRASAGFCLGDIDSNGKEGARRLPLSGRAMIWPIYRALRSCVEGSERQLWLIGKMEFISDVLGQKLATRLLERQRVSRWNLR
jgi:hypothetical protein